MTIYWVDLTTKTSIVKQITQRNCRNRISSSRKKPLNQSSYHMNTYTQGSWWSCRLGSSPLPWVRGQRILVGCISKWMNDWMNKWNKSLALGNDLRHGYMKSKYASGRTTTTHTHAHVHTHLILVSSPKRSWEKAQGAFSGLVCHRRFDINIFLQRKMDLRLMLKSLTSYFWKYVKCLFFSRWSHLKVGQVWAH